MSIPEIKAAVMQLSPNEFAEFVQWFDDYQESVWDKQIEADLKAGKLDHLIQQAEQAFKEGQCRQI
ncbi:MAG: hypothetical protein MUC60_07485 [Oscillatoria sp. Prado101]|jgi:hypothetical protein|nr:hypothetical protein [Oscillatoria sp. Prado101]